MTKIKINPLSVHLFINVVLALSIISDSHRRKHPVNWHEMRLHFVTITLIHLLRGAAL